MIFSRHETKDDIRKTIENDEAFDNLLAMACVGSAFCAILTFEDLVSNLVLTSKAKIKSKLNPKEVEKSDLFVERYNIIRSSPLGGIVTVMERSGITGRDIRYLRSIVEIRNEFVHKFMGQVPLPGDWERYDFNLNGFSDYTLWVIRHVNFAKSKFANIMVKHGLLEGEFGEFGALLWNPDEHLI